MKRVQVMITKSLYDDNRFFIETKREKGSSPEIEDKISAIIRRLDHQCYMEYDCVSKLYIYQSTKIDFDDMFGALWDYQKKLLNKRTDKLSRLWNDDDYSYRSEGEPYQYFYDPKTRIITITKFEENKK